MANFRFWIIDAYLDVIDLVFKILILQLYNI